jgi:hypothetical protein
MRERLPRGQKRSPLEEYGVSPNLLSTSWQHCVRRRNRTYKFGPDPSVRMAARSLPTTVRSVLTGRAEQN